MKDIKITKISCRACGHSWVPRQPNIHICPKCKSARWNEKKRK